jgi:hypothetical protein
MARNVIFLGVLALGVAFAVPAAAQQNGGYVAVSRMQIDPGMIVMTDEDPPKQDEKTASQGHAAPHEHIGGGVPLNQLGVDSDPDAPAGDDPFADDATQSDAVYTA